MPGKEKELHAKQEALNGEEQHLANQMFPRPLLRK